MPPDEVLADFLAGCLRCSEIFSVRGTFDCIDDEEGVGSAVDVDGVGKSIAVDDEGTESKGGCLWGKSIWKGRGTKSGSPCCDPTVVWNSSSKYRNLS